LATLSEADELNRRRFASCRHPEGAVPGEVDRNKNEGNQRMSHDRAAKRLAAQWVL
jgi:hypothetical protein